GNCDLASSVGVIGASAGSSSSPILSSFGSPCKLNPACSYVDIDDGPKPVGRGSQGSSPFSGASCWSTNVLETPRYIFVLSSPLVWRRRSSAVASSASWAWSRAYSRQREQLTGKRATVSCSLRERTWPVAGS